jgi:uncharacterized membrane protein (UPF0127 family)
MQNYLLKLMAALAVIFFVGACSAGEDQLTLTTSTGTYTFTVELADNDDERARGLMFRQELAPDAGMLFDFGAEREVAFWMRNTFISLDMIFVGADGIVKTIHEKAIPQDPTSIPSGVPVRFVLEIPGGRAREIGLQPGDSMKHARVTTSD